jgi:hypothetical protein
MLTPVYGMMGSCILAAGVNKGFGAYGSLSGAILMSIFGASTLGSLFAAPVTLLIWPLLRPIWAHRKLTNFFLLLVCSLLGAFLWPTLAVWGLDTFHRLDNALALGGLGAFSALVTTPAYYFATHGKRRIGLAAGVLVLFIVLALPLMLNLLLP